MTDDQGKPKEKPMHAIEARLAELGITLPATRAPAANYIPYKQVGQLLFVSGQLAFTEEGLMHPGIVGDDVTPEEGAAAARRCGMYLLAQVKAACEGDWDRLDGCVKLEGFVQATAAFKNHPEVINGASNLMVDVLGEAGRHSRFAVGAPSLPRNASVEIAGVFALR
jgi:enamine deaminase RidA (YjgF/YER057c/UK114 family)